MLFLFYFFSQTSSTVAIVLLLVGSSSCSTLLIGAGYSNDNKTVVDQNCFIATTSSKTKQYTPVKLSKSLSFSELEKAFTVNGSYKIDNFDRLLKFRNYQETDRSLLLYFYASYVNEVKEKIKGNGLQALTEFGQISYKNNKKSFGIVCGDHYVSSYIEGAYLIIQTSVLFKNQKEKEEFKATYGPDYGSIFKTYKKVHSLILKLGSSASIGVTEVLQVGGDSNKLFEILDSEDYYCKITAFKKCTNTALKLLKYTNDDFAKQVKEDDELIDFYVTGIEPVQKIGLAPYKSRVRRPFKWLETSINGGRKVFNNILSNLNLRLKN